MDQVSLEEIDKVWTNFGTMAPADHEKLLSTMQEDQPDLLMYLVESGEDVLEQQEKELLLNFGLLIWYTMAYPQKKEAVSRDQLEKVEEDNVRLLESLEGATEEAFWDQFDTMVNAHNQVNVLNVAVDELLYSLEDGYVTEEHVMLLFFMLKTIVDCLDM